MNPMWFLPFFLAVILLFTFPGMIVLEKTKLPLAIWPKLFFGTVIGYILFTLAAFLLIVLKLDILIIPSFILVDICFYKTIKKHLSQIRFSTSPLTALIFFVGIIGQLAVIAPSGWNANGDLLFWSSHAHDASWHIALTNEIQRGFPLQNPEFAGEKLVNYHIFSDIAPAVLNKYLKIPQLELYFRLFPLFYSLLLGTSAFFLGKEIGKSTTAGLWSTFFVYFAGSFGYIVTLAQGRGIGGESLFWGSQIQSSIGNPPFIAANIIFVTFLYFFLQLQGRPNKTLFTICALLLGSLTVFKIYGAIVLFGALGLTAVWQVIRERKLGIAYLLAPSVLLSLGLFLPFYAKTSSFLIFEPWWHIRTIIVEPSRLNLLDWELRRQTYIYEHNWKRVIFLEGLGFLIFFFGNLGMRFIGLVGLVKFVKNSLSNYFQLVFVSAIVISLAIPLLFLQKGVAGGTANFLQYFILLFGFLAALTISELTAHLKNKLLKYSFIGLFVLLAIPTQIGLLREFYSRPAFTKISRDELAALAFIKHNTPENAVILTPPYDQYLNLGGATPNIWDWFDTSYVAAFSARRTYFDDYEQVDIMGYNYKTHLEAKEKIFAGSDSQLARDLLNQIDIDLVYFPKAVKPKTEPSSWGLKQIYENEEVEIWSFD